MKPPYRFPRRTEGETRLLGFTLLELLVTVAIVGILASLVFVLMPRFQAGSQKAAALNALRQLGSGLVLFASENQNVLPGRVQSEDKWPRLLLPYIGGDKRLYGQPGDKKSYVFTGADPLSNERNNTSYILNGFNDLGALQDEAVTVNLLSLQKPTETILMGTQSGTGHFYLDLADGDQNSVLNTKAFGSGSCYLFADGSARYVSVAEYSHDLWLVDKGSDILQ